MIENIWVVRPDGYIHSQALFPFARSLCQSFCELGINTKIVTEPDYNKRTLVLGAHLLGDVWLPKNWVLYNSEQIGAGYGDKSDYLALLARHERWDYSQENIKSLANKNLMAKYCPLGYSSNLTQIRSCEQDIDVLFYGSLNDRRNRILNSLADQCHLVNAFGIYEDELDILIARSKVVLNMHYYDTAIFEIFRCSYLLANRKCVISEYGKDQILEKQFAAGVVFTNYENLASVCLAYVRNQCWRELIGRSGLQLFSKMKQIEYLKAVL